MIRFHPRMLACAAAIAAATAWSAGALAQQGDNSQGSSPSQASPNQNPSRRNNANQAMPGAQQQPEDQSARQSEQSPEGFLLIREDVVYLMANEPQNHFTQALADLSQKDPHKAAGELNVAAAYIEDISSRGNDNDKRQLTQCADQLRQRAQQLRSGTAPSPQELSSDFARASLALADHFQKSADADLSGHHQIMAGYDLRAAATSLGDGLAWTNQQPDPQQRQAIFQARRAAADFLRAAPRSEQQANANWEQPEESGQNNTQSNSNENNSPMAANQNPQQVSKQLAQQIQQAQQQLAQNNGQNNQNGSTAGNR